MRALELKMLYPCERPTSMVMANPLTLPKQDVEELEDTLAKMKQERDMWEERFHALSRKHRSCSLSQRTNMRLLNFLKTKQ